LRVGEAMQSVVGSSSTGPRRSICLCLNSLALVVEQHMQLKVASLHDAVFHTSSDSDEDHRRDCFETSPDILTGVWFTDKPHMCMYMYTYMCVCVYMWTI
jgi:hypothetical protein